MTEERKESKLVAWLKGLPRWHKDIDVSGMKNHDGLFVAKIRFVVNRKSEEDAAIECAYEEADRRAKKYAAGAVDAVKQDPEYVSDFKTVQALWRACKNPDDPVSPGKDNNDWYPIFPTAQWMKDNLTGRELAYLLNHYNACEFEAAGIPPNLDRERIAAYRDGCVAMFDTSVPDEAFKKLPREVLSTLTVLAMKQWHDEREVLIARLADLESAAEARGPSDIPAAGTASSEDPGPL